MAGRAHEAGLRRVIVAWGKWRLEFRVLSIPFIDLYRQWPKQWGIWWEAA